MAGEALDPAEVAEAEAAEDSKQALIALMLAVEAAPPPITLTRRLQVVGARNLKSLDRLGKADPFALVTWNHELAEHAPADTAQPETGHTSVVKRTLAPEWSETFTLPMTLAARNHLRVEVFSRNRRGPPTFLGALELGGEGFVGLAVPSNGATREFELVESELPYRDNKHVRSGTGGEGRAYVSLSSPDTDSANLTQTVDPRMKPHGLDRHRGRHRPRD